MAPDSGRGRVDHARGLTVEAQEGEANEALFWGNVVMFMMVKNVKFQSFEHKMEEHDILSSNPVSP